MLVQVSAVLALLIASSAFGSTGMGNGGDVCENRFKIVRDDIASWIVQGGAVGLRLPSTVSPDRYHEAMLDQIVRAVISCTEDWVMIENTEKTCRNFVSSSGTPQVICNAKRFMETREVDQYLLVHHEYAGLAGFEVSQGGDSRYSISNQLAAYLEDQVVKKLAIKPVRSVPPELTDILPRWPNGSIRNTTYFEAESICSSRGQRLPTAREWALYAQAFGAEGVSEIDPEDGLHILIRGLDSVGSPDLFYYSSWGYLRSKTQDYHSYWSSSILPLDEVPAGHIEAYTFSNFWGVINSSGLDEPYATVRCVQPR